MPPKHEDSETELRAENIVVSVKSFWSVLAGIAAVGVFMLRLSFQVGALQEQMGDVNRKLTQLDQFAKLEAKVESLKENGSDNLKAMSADLARLRHDFDVHVAETTKATK